MSIVETDPNRQLWQEWAAGDHTRPWESIGTEPPGISEQETPTGLWLRPPAVQAMVRPAVLLAIHGGGFVSGSVRTHARLFGHLALASRIPTFAAEYGLVPEHVYPSQLDTVMAAYRELAGSHTVAIVGDSCGATLAFGTALRTRDEGLAPPAGLLVMSAWMDLTVSGASYDAGRDPFFGRRPFVQQLADGYLAGAGPDAPYASPLQADLRGLPPTYLQVGGDEALLDDTTAMADRLRAAGVPTSVDVFAGQLHTFQMAAGRAATADDAIGRAGAWLRSTLLG